MSLMINKLYVYDSDTFYPFYNQAIEEYFLDSIEEKSILLYLWQNKHTIVIGRNQNAYNECNIPLVDNDGIYLARRLSGGGAVYHDLGNLNFTFIAHKDLYDKDIQNRIILNALNSLGIDALISGRNDLTIEDKKFSGHAYYKKDDRMYHHGTLMLNVDFNALNKYLNVSLLKLRDKSISSVKSRVINLKEIKNDLTIPLLKQSLINAFTDYYQKEITYYNDIDEDKLNNYLLKYENHDWRYGKLEKHQFVKESRFNWATVKLEYDLVDNIINNLVVYTDALDVDNVSRIIDEINNKNINDLKIENNDTNKDDLIKMILETYYEKSNDF